MSFIECIITKLLLQKRKKNDNNNISTDEHNLKNPIKGCSIWLNGGEIVVHGGYIVISQLMSQVIIINSCAWLECRLNKHNLLTTMCVPQNVFVSRDFSWFHHIY